jgi:hypothetical protein
MLEAFYPIIICFSADFDWFLGWSTTEAAVTMDGCERVFVIVLRAGFLTRLPLPPEPLTAG